MFNSRIIRIVNMAALILFVVFALMPRGTQTGQSEVTQTVTEEAGSEDLGEITVQGDAQSCDVQNANEQIMKREKALAQIAEMSTEEKVGQLIISGFQGTSMNNGLKSFITDNRLCGVIFLGRNINSENQTAQLIKDFKKASLEISDIPMLFAIDEEGGTVSRIPISMPKTQSAKEIGRIGDVQRAYEAGRQIASNLRKLGFNLDFAPVADIDLSGSSVVRDRAFSSDAAVVADMAQSFYRGLKEGGVFGTAKHFPGHGTVGEDSHKVLPVDDTSLDILRRRELLPFERLILEGVEMVMTGHLLAKGIDEQYPASLSYKAKIELLREEMGYEGVIITDDLGMDAIKEHYTIEEAAVLALRSGSDMLLFNDSVDARAGIAALVEAIDRGEISMEQLDASVLRVLMLKSRLV